MNSLNSKQQEAVETLDGPLLVIAGAGSGKTRVLTHRIANLLKQNKADPTQILAVTFTNKAAREMKERVEKMVGRNAEQLWVNTFHSTCVKILRKEIEVLGYSTQFVIYDDADQITAIKRCLNVLNWDANQLHPRVIQSQLNKAKNQGLTVQQFQKKGSSLFDDKISKVFELYQKLLKKADALDFGDLLSLTVQIFKECPSIVKKYQEKFRYCMVDEYQDTNHIQYRLIKFLCEHHQNICVVGDEDQSIYSWRGADISNILSFEKDFPKARVIKLEQNYRSTQNIIESTSHLISNNRNRKPKKLFTENEKGSPIQLVFLEDEYHEARFVVGEIMKYQEGGEHQHRDVSIFYRTHAQSRVFEDILRENQISYQIYGGIQFYSRAEIKDILGYFKFISNPKDHVSFSRVINTPSRGIGEVTVEKIFYESQKKNVSPYEATKILCSETILNTGVRKKLSAFIKLIEEFIQLKQGMNIQELFHEILDKTRYSHYLQEEETIEAESRRENLAELDSALNEYLRKNPKGTLENYLEAISLMTDLDSMNNSDDCVKLMTLHSAKGLEFPVVFMVGLEEGLFPHSQSDWSSSELEEERRLCYVGMTRAKKFLYLTYTNARRIRGTPHLNLASRFLSELPKEYLNEIDLRRQVKRVKQVVSEEDDFNQDISEKPFFSGMRIHHPLFGTGVICRVEGEEENTKITIKFDRGEIKKFMACQTPLDQV